MKRKCKHKSWGHADFVAGRKVLEARQAAAVQE
jgi:hypothetical protein